MAHSDLRIPSRMGTTPEALSKLRGALAGFNIRSYFIDQNEGPQRLAVALSMDLPSVRFSKYPHKTMKGGFQSAREIGDFLSSLDQPTMKMALDHLHLNYKGNHFPLRSILFTPDRLPKLAEWLDEAHQRGFKCPAPLIIIGGTEDREHRKIAKSPLVTEISKNYEVDGEKYQLCMKRGAETERMTLKKGEKWIAVVSADEIQHNAYKGTPSRHEFTFTARQAEGVFPYSEGPYQPRHPVVQSRPQQLGLPLGRPPQPTR